MFRAVISHSMEARPEDAARQCVERCAAELAGGPPARAGLLFTSYLDADHQALVEAVDRAFPGLELVGCTTDGELSSQLSYADDSMVLCLFTSNKVRFAAGLGRGLGADPAGAVAQARDEALDKLGATPSLGLVFPDGLAGRGASLECFWRGMFGGAPLIGGAAGDLFRLRRTVQFAGNRAESDAVAVLLMAGELRFGLGVASGWSPIGRRLPLGRVTGNRLHDLGGVSALDFYRSHLGDNEDEYHAFPLAVYEPGAEEHYLRAPGFLHHETGAIDFMGDLPGRAEVQLTEFGRDDIVAAAGEATRKALASYSGRAPAMALAVSCASRKHILGSRVQEEGELLARTGAPFLGFYSYGEIAPLNPDGPVCHHNDTFVVLSLGAE